MHEQAHCTAAAGCCVVVVLVSPGDLLPVCLELSQTKNRHSLPSRVGGAAQSLGRPLEGSCFRRSINNAGVDPREGGGAWSLR